MPFPFILQGPSVYTFSAKPSPREPEGIMRVRLHSYGRLWPVSYLFLVSDLMADAAQEAVNLSTAKQVDPDFSSRISHLGNKPYIFRDASNGGEFAVHVNMSAGNFDMVIHGPTWRAPGLFLLAEHIHNLGVRYGKD